MCLISHSYGILTTPVVLGIAAASCDGGNWGRLRARVPANTKLVNISSHNRIQENDRPRHPSLSRTSSLQSLVLPLACEE
jgi:hypothetical protein